MKHSKGIVIYTKHKPDCTPESRAMQPDGTRKTCGCPRLIKYRIYPNGKAEPAEEQCFGRYSAATLAVAEADLQKRRMEILRGEIPMPHQITRLKFMRLCEIFYELHAKNLVTDKNYLRYFRVFAKFWKDRYVDEMTFEDIESYRKEREKIVSISTVNKEHMALTCMFNCLKRWRGRRDPAFMEMVDNKLVKLPEENPGSLVKKKSELGRRRTRVLSMTEFLALIQAAPDNLKWVYKFAVGTMLRKKDLQNLNPNSFDKYSNALKGTQTKTMHSFEVPLFPELSGYIEQRISDMTTWGMNGFYGKSRDKLLDFANFQKEHWATVEKADIKDFQFRDLRRTGATWLYSAGVPLNVISQLLGHSSVQMTERYIGIDRMGKKSAAELMAGILQQQALPARSLGVA